MRWLQLIALLRISLGSRVGAGMVLSAGSFVCTFLLGVTLNLGVSVERKAMDRAARTAVVLAETENGVDTLMATLMFEDIGPARTRANVCNEVLDETVRCIPVCLGDPLGDHALVGTSLDYFTYRGLAVAMGRLPAWTGEVVLSETLASERDLEVGDTLESDVAELFTVDRPPSVTLTVVGLLAGATGPDASAVFTGVSTVHWMNGRLHGHDEGPEVNTGSAQISRDQRGLHAHGDPSAWPVHGFLVDVENDRSRDLILGQVERTAGVHAWEPRRVMGHLLSSLRQTRDLLARLSMVLSVAVVGLLALVAVQDASAGQGQRILFRRLGLSEPILVGMGIARFVFYMTLGSAFAWAMIPTLGVSEWSGIAV
ncbi:MAG: ABC transporter permease [Myxococcota bacterium]